MLTALLVIAILVLLIVAHEFGHFICAKIFGVKVEEFGFGFPPRAFLLGKWGDTEYTLNWIPFGGFVRLYGEDENEPRGRGSFVAAPRLYQAIILVAGVVMNVVVAWILFTCAYGIGILHVVDRQNVPGEQLLVTDIVPGSPADAAGLRAGDIIASISDPDGATAAETPDGVLAFVQERGGEELTITYVREHATSTTSVRPANAVVAEDAGRPAIGVGVALVTASSVGVLGAMHDASLATYNAFILVLAGLWTIIKETIHGAPDLSSVTGPIGLVSAVGEAAQNGVGYILSLAAFISVNLAVINLIPIPALDGGRILIVIIEAIMRKSAPRLAVQLLNTVGVALIILLMIAVTYHDIINLIA